VNINPLLVIGLIMLGMALGAILTSLHFKRNLRDFLSNTDFRNRSRNSLSGTKASS
jgi:hypothetical protein